MTALINAAAAAQPRLTLNAASTRGAVMMSQKPLQVRLAVLTNRVDSGISTTRPR
jgi:hypothetical protein